MEVFCHSSVVTWRLHVDHLREARPLGTSVLYELPASARLRLSTRAKTCSARYSSSARRSW
eukprot:3705755-Pleurochrysis_carterae.AAC.2